MAVSFDEVKKTIRTILHDDYGTLFGDTAMLDYLVNLAQLEVVLDTLELKGTFKVVENAVNRIALPEDFICLYRVKSKSVGVYSHKELTANYGNWLGHTGNIPHCLCFDLCDEVIVFPQVPEGTEVCTIEYCRLPKEDVIEVSNVNAVINFVLYLVSMIQRKDSSAFLKKYKDSLNAQERTKSKLQNRLGANGIYY